MKRSRKLTVLLAVVLTLAMVLSIAACGGDSTSGGTTSGTDTGGTDTGGTDTGGTDTGGDASSGGGELVVVVGPDPDTIDPALNSAVDGATLLIHAFEGLYSLDANGTPIPGQAESVDISEDGLTYTFKLREGLKWSDGSPLTAQDYIWSWQRAIDPDTAADYGYMFESIDGVDTDEDHMLLPGASPNVQAPDDRTLVVKLKARTPYFLELTAFPTFFPVKRDIVEANGDAWATNVDTYIGNGPYRMIEWVPGSHISYEKNPNYWNLGALGPDTIRFVLMDDQNAMLAGFRAGELKFIDDVPTDEIKALKSESEFYVEGQLGTYYISFNVQDPELSNPKLREALTLAVDREYICVEIGQTGQQPAGAFVAIGIGDAQPGVEFREVGGDYYDPTSAGFDANVARAKELIAEIYPDGNVPTFEYIYNTSTGHQLIGEALQQMWQDIGVTVTLESQEWATFLNTRKNGEYQIARNGWLNDYNDPMGMLDMWITGGGNNDAQWGNSEYDSRIAQAKNSGDQAERMRLMHEAEDILFSEWVLCPIYYYVDIFMCADSVQGFYSSPLGYKYFMYVTAF